MRKTFSTLLATAAAAFAFSAHAESPTLATDVVASGTSRAQVRAELAAFRQSGSNPWATSYNPLRSFQGSKTRQQVIAEFLAGREQVAQMHGEDSGSQRLAQAAHGAPQGQALAHRQ